MLNCDVIEKEILNLENHDTTYATCERLAWLYIVRDHMKSHEKSETQKSKSMTGSEFLEATSNVDISKLMEILNEHMDMIKVLHPKEYSSLISRIKQV